MLVRRIHDDLESAIEEEVKPCVDRLTEDIERFEQERQRRSKINKRIGGILDGWTADLSHTTAQIASLHTQLQTLTEEGLDPMVGRASEIDSLNRRLGGIHRECSELRQQHRKMQQDYRDFRADLEGILRGPQ